MMNLLYKATILVLLVLICSSCGEDFFTTTLEIDPPEHTDQLVTNAFLNIDDGKIEVAVSQTYSVVDVDQEFELVNDAEVILRNDQGLDQLVPASGQDFGFNYFADDIVSQGNTYELEVKYGSFNSRATASIPNLVTLYDFEFIEDGGIDSEGEDRSRVEFSFDDPEDEENYYELTIYMSNEGDPTLPSYATYTDTNDPSGSRGYNYQSLLISDASFDGERKRFKALMYPTTKEEVEGRLFVRWKVVSKEYFQYSKTLNIASELEDNPFATPVQIFTNFEGGIGIFSVYREKNYSVF